MDVQVSEDVKRKPNLFFNVARMIKVKCKSHMCNYKKYKKYKPVQCEKRFPKNDFLKTVLIIIQNRSVSKAD